MNNKHKKTSLALLLSLALSCATPICASAANSGGVPDKPSIGDYTGGSNNTITTSNGHVSIDTTVTGSVRGGYSDGGDDVTGNTVDISGSGVTVGDVYGGYSETGNANNNTVNISGGSVATGATYGGQSRTGAANNNAVTISNSNTLNASIFGGTGRSGASNNIVNISNSSAGVIMGADSMNSADNNEVNISNGSIISSEVYGAMSEANASNNKVKILDSSVDGNVYGAQSFSADTIGNKVKILDSSVGGNVYGAQSFSADTINNIVMLGNATVSGDIYGGESVANATNNTVTIENLITTTENSTVYGGFNSGGAGDAFTSNTLNWASKNKIKQVANFEYYNFTLPANAQNGDILIEITGADPTDLNNSKVKLVAVQGERQWQNGESVTLINNNNGITGNYELIDGKAPSGLRIYDYTLSKDPNNIVVTIGNSIPKPNPEPPKPAKHSKSLSEGRMAALGFINTAADMVAGSGLQNAMSSSSDKYDIFGSMNYSDTKLKTDGGTDVKGTSMLIGASRKLDTKGGHMVLGAFFESGWSSYNTAENFEHIGTVSANGKSNYFGGGLLARNVRDNGLYVEGSLRVGRMSTDYNSYDIGSKYDIKSTYYGLHVGIGKVFKLNDSNDLDVYGKYFWSHQNSASAMIKGDKIDFDSINSNRLRIGARLNMVGGGNGIKTYVGLAYEHEFSGSVGATALGGSIASPSIKGGTGIGEIGMVYKPSTKSAFSMDVGLNGFIGKRQGIGGGVKLNWGF